MNPGADPETGNEVAVGASGVTLNSGDPALPSALGVIMEEGNVPSPKEMTMTATDFATDDPMVHLALPCPACDRPVDVVVDTVRHQARWACVRCQLLGFAPFVLETQPHAPGSTLLVPSA